ncbi:hypothetical protein TEA_014234 [Camellia sinensis var. sinensis]|uniref:RING-type E3 ubiquitin transferase n=1 Tax=Camellia sinensis var. sinensis TaxID=542762 RepID=A0A4S4DPV8_CAMSN|nr:hypothetical protein TEA_014234 [Camellia sinensis var. sinensis]
MESNNMPPYYPNTGYSITGKIMLSAIIVLFGVVVFMICLHLYARWYLLRSRRQHHVRHHNHRRTQLVFYVEPDTPSATASRGLDAVVLNSLPVFVYSASASAAALECAVCLSEFEENEKVFMICLHLYARWYLLRSRRQHHVRHHNHRRTQLVFYVEPDTPSATASRGLDAVVLNSLPVFVYSASASAAALECAVCLSEFEENEKGRLLPKCNHSFHINCIDMWFHSHSTCPLCRSPVEPVPENRSRVEPAGFEPCSSSGTCAACQHEGASSSSLGDRRKATVTIDVPRTSELGSELGPSSPASQGFKSPASRLLSLKRILSFNRKGVAVSPSSGIGTSFGSPMSELDIECGGRDESTQHQTRIQTPR